MTSAVEPLITVITPAYNVSEYLHETIDSVLAQTETRFEYLIVDDESTDDTLALARKRAETDARIQVIAAPHGGSAEARNVALRQARGRYIAFIDGDDRWNPQFLQKSLRFLESLPSDVGAVFCRARVISANGGLAGFRWQPAGRVDFDDMLVLNCPPRNGSSLFMRRSCFDAAGEFDTSLKSGIDFDMWLRIGLDGPEPLFWGSRDYLIDLRLRPGAISNNMENRFNHMGELLDRYVPKMQRLPPGRAYVRPALLAYRAGYDAKGHEWATIAKTAGTASVLQDRFGSRMLTWDIMPEGGRSKVRAGKLAARNGILRGASKAASLLKR